MKTLAARIRHDKFPAFCLFTLALWSACVLRGRAQQAGQLDADFFAFASTVAVQADGKVIVGGNFPQIGQTPRRTLTRLNTDGSVDQSFNVGAGPNGSVYAVTLIPDGRVIVAGGFDTINGIARTNLARLNADGSVDTTFNPSVNGVVRGVAEGFNGKVAIYGEFSTVNGIPRSNITRLNADGSLDASFQASIPGSESIFALELQSDGKLVLGGSFSSVNGVSRRNVARLNNNGTVDTSFASFGLNDYVSAVAITPNGKVMVAGDFTAATGATRNRVARYNPNGSLDVTFDPGVGPNATINSVASDFSGKVIIVGPFSSFGGIARNNIARLQEDGNLDPLFDPGAGANGDIYNAALLPDGKVIIAGSFSRVGGQPRNYVARLNADGTVDAGFDPGSPSIVAMVIQPTDDKVIVGGAFTTAGGQPINALARLLTNGNLDTSFDAGFSPGDSVQALQLQPSDGAVLVSALVPTTTGNGGGQGQPAGATQKRRWPDAQTVIRNPIKRCGAVNGQPQLSFNPQAQTDGTSFALGVQPADGKILVAGSFAKLNDTSGFANLGRLNTDGTLDNAFAPQVNGTVRAVLPLNDGRVVAGGTFTQVNGQSRAGLTRLLANGTLDNTFNPAAGVGGPGATINTVKLQRDGKLLVAGTFSTVNGGTPRSCVARLSSDGTLDPGFDAGAITFIAGGGGSRGDQFRGTASRWKTHHRWPVRSDWHRHLPEGGPSACQRKCGYHL